MAVSLRLSRIGKKKAPFYRIVAADSRKQRDGEACAILGTYDALKSTVVCINIPEIDAWVLKGAQMTDSVRKIYNQAKRGA